MHALGTYFNDSWRVNRRLTVNLGVRWEPFISVKDNNGFVTAFIRDNYEKGIRSTVYPNAPIGVVFRGDAGFPDDGGNSLNKWKQIAPAPGWCGIRPATTSRPSAWGQVSTLTRPSCGRRRTTC